MTTPNTPGTRVYAPDSPEAGPLVDTTGVLLPDGTEVDRQRVSLAGLEPDSDVPVLNRAPTADDFGLVTRPVAPQGRSTYGITDTTVAPGTTETVVDFLQEVPVVLHGFTAMGNGDGVFHLLVDDDVVTLGQIDNINRSINRLLPIGIQVQQGAVVRLMVRCASEKAPCTYEGTVYTEVVAEDG